MIQEGNAYPGLAAGSTASGNVKLTGSGDTPQSLTLPIYWYTVRPIIGVCTDNTPAWSGFGVG